MLNCQSGLLPTFPPANYSAYRNISQVELFELFWDELLVKMKLYFVRKGKNIFVANIAESRTSFGIIMVSGYNYYPNENCTGLTITVKEMKKSSKRGNVCVAVGKHANHDEEMKLVRWKNNNIVTICSTVFGTEPIKKVQRWSRIEKKIDVDRPYIVERYNKTMGGIDHQDQRVNNYRRGIRGKRVVVSFVYVAS